MLRKWRQYKEALTPLLFHRLLFAFAKPFYHNAIILDSLKMCMLCLVLFMDLWMFFEYNIDTKIVAANAGRLRMWPLSCGSFAIRSISYQSLPPSIPHKEQISDCEEAFSMQRQVCSWPDGSPLSPDYISHHFKLLLEKINCRIFVFTICGIRREVYYWKMGLISRLYRNF